ncbi:MAG: hypothetical protein WAW11_05435 [Patescibacteria group bacterium]
MFAEQFSLSSYEELPPEKVRNYFEVVYQMWGKFGFMGDVIAVKVLKTPGDYVYYLSFIGRLAFHKPGLAADLLVLIETKTSNYFVGIKRKNDPGRGKLAFPGGFINVDGYHLDTPLETIIHEAEEEINLKIKIDREVDLKNYSPVNALATVDYFGQDLKGEIMFLDICETGDNEKMPSTGLKRVYTTYVFALLLDMTSLGVNEAKLNNWLKAGDDASDLIIVDLNDNEKLEFGLAHYQQIYDENIDQLLSMLSNE